MDTNDIHLEFKKEREFGDVINATFVFIKQNFKPLGKALLYYAGPFILFTAISMALMFNNLFDGIFSGMQSNPNFLTGFFGRFFLYYFIMLVFMIFSHAALNAVTYGYISLYVDKGKDNFNLSDVFQQVKRFFFPILGSLFVCGLLIGIASVFLYIPGIYLGVSLSLVIVILVYEKKGFGHAFSKSFELTHTSWWWTLLLLFVMYTIIGIISYIFVIIQSIFTFGSIFNSLSSGKLSEFSPLMILFSILTTVITYSLYVVPKIAISFHYFSLSEKKYKTSLYKKIDEIKPDEIKAED